MCLEFFFMLRPGKHTKSDNNAPFKLQDAKLCHNATPLPIVATPTHELDSTTQGWLTFTTQKNSIKAEVITHGMTGHNIVCPVRTVVCQVTYLRLRNAPLGTPLLGLVTKQEGPPPFSVPTSIPTLHNCWDNGNPMPCLDTSMFRLNPSSECMLHACSKRATSPLDQATNFCLTLLCMWHLTPKTPKECGRFHLPHLSYLPPSHPHGLGWSRQALRWNGRGWAVFWMPPQPILSP